MLKSARILFAAAILMASAATVYAGGFVLLLGNPQANPDARAMNAAVVAKAVGCGKAENAVLKGTAIGVVNGKRESIPLKVTALKEAGTFAIARQWPSEGQWVLELTATEGGRNTRTVVGIIAGGVDHNHPKLHASPSDVAAMLEAAPVLEARK